ncbi:DUF1080 domain-containing protein [Microbulbifer sp. SH-1]|uniref:3-keto-disaccharide hydrolase n=1 Tax=Microbulbifer sp. SH-1 TaxID=2681547 RepID=UPI001F0EC756|nr:DUF1080 domain-containing protein [Microbulbifer sp. SH-1]
MGDLTMKYNQMTQRMRSIENNRLPTFRSTAFAMIIPCFFTVLSCTAETTDKALEPWQLAEKSEQWEPVPKVVEAPADAPPSDALVLFDGTNLSQWESAKGGKAEWALEEGVLTVVPGKGDIRTKRAFCDAQVHLEWRTPAQFGDRDGQRRNNSGVFLQERYEVQILDSHANPTYSNGQAASIYKQHIPLVNTSRPPGEWQTYDIIFKAPRFEHKKLVEPATITVLHNGVLVQNHKEILGTTVWIGEPEYEFHDCAPIALQDHNDPVSFRNIWVREL